MAGLEDKVELLTIEVRSLIATLKERCPHHEGEIERLWCAVRNQSNRFWLGVLAIVGALVTLYATHMGGSR